MSEELHISLGVDVLEAKVTRQTAFNECFHCPYFQNGCSGPNIVITSLERVCEILQISRARHGYSYDKLSELTGLSKIGVMRILRKEVKDPGFLSIQALARVLLGDPAGKYPCALHLVSAQIEEERAAAAAAVEEADRLRAELAAIEQAHSEHIAAIEQRHQAERENDRRIIDYLKNQVGFEQSQIGQKDALLDDRRSFLKRKDRVIVILSILLGLCVLSIIAALIIDRINPEVGFFWRDYSAYYDFTRGSNATLPPFGLL